MSTLFGGTSGATKHMQQLQQQQAAQAATDKAQVTKNTTEDQTMQAKRASMGFLSNILSSKSNQKLGG